MEKYLYFMEQTDGAFDAAQDAVMYPSSAFKGFSASGTATTLLLHFHGLLGQDEDVHDVVTLTITSNKQKEVMTAIAQAITSTGSMKDGVVVIADDSNSVYADARITACAIAVTAVD